MLWRSQAELVLWMPSVVDPRLTLAVEVLDAGELYLFVDV